MFSRVIPIQRLLYGHLAPVGGGGTPLRHAASDHPAPTSGAMPDRSTQARAAQPKPPGVAAVQELASTES